MKYILILTHADDFSANNVIEWLRYYNAPFIRWNTEDDFDFECRINSEQTSIIVLCNGIPYDLENIGAVWFRRGYINLPKALINSTEMDLDAVFYIERHLFREKESIHNYIYWELMEKPHINCPHKYDINKLQVLNCAKEIGLCIPNTIITHSLENINNICIQNNHYITKSISDNLVIRRNDVERMMCLTNLVDKLKDTTNCDFYYSLFQEKVNKKFELRIFFLFDEYFPAAIFNDNIDGRVLSDGNNLVRICPVSIPEQVLNKLKALMKKINLESGSIDMIVTEKDEYVFLEVNPVGHI